MTRLPALVAALLLAGCAPLPRPPACGAGQRPSVNDVLYFGTATPDGPVSHEQWNAFLAEVVTPRFPSGLTTWEALGQWRSADGSLTHEASHVLNLVHDGGAGAESSVRAIIQAYKTRYRQEAVLRLSAAACASF